MIFDVHINAVCFASKQSNNHIKDGTLFPFPPMAFRTSLITLFDNNKCCVGVFGTLACICLLRKRPAKINTDVCLPSFYTFFCLVRVPCQSDKSATFIELLCLRSYFSIHTILNQTISFARPFAHLYVCVCVFVLVGTTEWECGETFTTQSACSPIATLLRHYICVDRYMHFPSFGIRYQCEWPRWRIALFQFSLIFTICAVGSSTDHAIFSVLSKNQQQFANRQKKKSKSKLNQSIGFNFIFI